MLIQSNSISALRATSTEQRKREHEEKEEKTNKFQCFKRKILGAFCFRWETRALSILFNSKLLIFIEIFYDVNVKRWKQHNRFTSFHCKTLIQQLIHGIPFDIRDKIIRNLSNVRINLKYSSRISIEVN